MRKNRTLACLLATLALTLTACSNGDDPMAPDGSAKEITILTRTATATEGEETTSETFTSPFTLELWNDGVHTTHQMTYTEGTGWSPAKVDKLGTTINALAYRGNTVTSLDNYSVELTEDQSNEDAFNAADVMIATGTVATDGSLSLNFKHHFAKVTFYTTINDEYYGTYNISNLYVVTKDSSTPTVTAYNPSLDVYHAHVTAGTYAEGDTFAKVDIGGNQLVVKMQGETTLTAGTHYTFFLTVGKDKVTIEQVSTNDIGNPFGSGWDNNHEKDLYLY